MAKRKSKAKAKSAPPEPKPESTTRDTAACLLVAEAAAEISAMDCAAFSLLTFSQGEVPDEWKAPTATAVRKFMQFGWAAFHAFGGMDADWSKIADKLHAGLVR